MTNEIRGYSYDMVKRIKAADSAIPSVRLGLVCIERNIPVSEVAEGLNVSRQTVYAWFTGKFKPRHKQMQKIEQMLADFTTAPV